MLCLLHSYVSAVDKALKSFEYTSEWADLISALGKLNKVLLSHMKFPVIPRRIKISKRLAQCMHPALPSGVHLKALETYDIIFKCMGTNRLSHELFIYSAGMYVYVRVKEKKIIRQLQRILYVHLSFYRTVSIIGSCCYECQTIIINSIRDTLCATW